MSKNSEWHIKREEKNLLLLETSRTLFALAERTHPNGNILSWLVLTRNSLTTYFPEVVPPKIESVLSQIIEEFFCGEVLNDA
jgi:hypothetical protein